MDKFVYIFSAIILVVYLVAGFFYFQGEPEREIIGPEISAKESGNESVNEYFIRNTSHDSIGESGNLNFSAQANNKLLNITGAPKYEKIEILFKNVGALDFAIREPLLNRTPREPRIVKIFNDIPGIKNAIEVEWQDENGYTMVSYYVLEFRNENIVENLTDKLFPKFTNNLSEIVFSRRRNILNQSMDEYKFSSGFLKDYRMKIWSENRFAF
ncbi:MAG: hypothetical protein KAU95_02605, partial [Candidatus Aenigmarchaeota archaeon]|nr:hypothetical protein [Candidatus Aenigmarchaeota archaeon]